MGAGLGAFAGLGGGLGIGSDGITIGAGAGAGVGAGRISSGSSDSKPHNYSQIQNVTVNTGEEDPDVATAAADAGKEILPALQHAFKGGQVSLSTYLSEEDPHWFKVCGAALGGIGTIASEAASLAVVGAKGGASVGGAVGAAAGEGVGAVPGSLVGAMAGATGGAVTGATAAALSGDGIVWAEIGNVPKTLRDDLELTFKLAGGITFDEIMKKINAHDGVTIKPADVKREWAFRGLMGSKITIKLSLVDSSPAGERTAQASGDTKLVKSVVKQAMERKKRAEENKALVKQAVESEKRANKIERETIEMLQPLMAEKGKPLKLAGSIPRRSCCHRLWCCCCIIAGACILLVAALFLVSAFFPSSTCKLKQNQVGPCEILSATIRDFKQSHPDFELPVASLPKAGAATKGLVKNKLGKDGKPMFHGGATLSNKDNFDEWFRDVPGVNYRETIQLEMTQDATGTRVVDSSEFFPIDGKGFNESVNGHNFWFTLEMHTHFIYKGGERFTFRGDDDFWLFINGSLALDLGGTHGAVQETVNLDALKLNPGQRASFDVFFAERHTNESNFHVETGVDIEPNNFCLINYYVTPMGLQLRVCLPERLLWMLQAAIHMVLNPEGAKRSSFLQNV